MGCLDHADVMRFFGKGGHPYPSFWGALNQISSLQAAALNDNGERQQAYSELKHQIIAIKLLQDPEANALIEPLRFPVFGFRRQFDGHTRIGRF